ncbi:MAG: 3-phosphoshikimate 1-carboxyvinyltransferase [Candidatus Bathyarchaeota archaeon]
MKIAVVEETAALKGEVRAPSSKSYTHRAIIAASLSRGLSHIRSPLYSDDIFATIEACISFGVSIVRNETELLITGSSGFKAPLNTIDCKNSASTIRFLTPIAALAKGETVLDGSAGLRRRPIGHLVEALEKLEVKCSSNNGFPPVTVIGCTLKGGRTSLVGNVSSQFITGLIFACPLARRDTEIILTTPLESKPYVRLTLDVLGRHGIKIDISKNFRRFNIPSKQRYMSCDHEVPGDFSAAAFLLAAAAMTGSNVTVDNLFPDQPDSEIANILSKMGVAVKVMNSSIRVSSKKLRAVAIDARDIPDLVPVCAALACISEGTTRIYGAKRLRLKESDRLSVLSSELKKMGADVVDKAEELIIKGPNTLRGATINPHGDHRIAMACTIAGLKAKGKTEILEAECVDKSYPNFFSDLKKLGAKIYVG